MARTRSEIEAIVALHTGKNDQSTLMHSLCNNALRYAQMKHTWHESKVLSSDEPITEDSLSMDIPTTDLDSNTITVKEILSVRLIHSSADQSGYLSLRNHMWWDSKVLEPADNLKGWPKNGLHYGSKLYFDRPVQADLTARFRVVKELTFTEDSTVCPVPNLELYIEQYVTAYVFLNLELTESFDFWLTLAEGSISQRGRGLIGGSLGDAILADQREAAEEQSMSLGPFNSTRASITTQGYTNPFTNITYPSRQWYLERGC